MKNHINADFFKLILAFLLICLSFSPGSADASLAPGPHALHPQDQVILCSDVDDGQEMADISSRAFDHL